MIQWHQEPEYILAEKSVKMYPHWDHSRISNQIYKDQVLAKLKLLSRLHNMQADTLEEILSLALGSLRSQLERE